MPSPLTQLKQALEAAKEAEGVLDIIAKVIEAAQWVADPSSAIDLRYRIDKLRAALASLTEEGAEG